MNNKQYEIGYFPDIASLRYFIEEANRCNYEIIGFTESDSYGYTVIYKC